MWELVVKLGESSLFIGAITWLAKTTITNFFDKRAEEYKTEIDRRAEEFKTSLERTTEVFKSELEKAALEHEVRFRRIDEKSADVLSEIYGRLMALYQLTRRYLGDFDDDKPRTAEQLDGAQTVCDEFLDSLIMGRLYVDPNLWGKIRAIGNMLADICKHFGEGLGLQQAGSSTSDQHPWDVAKARIEQEADPLLVEIVSEFRKRIGVN